jgi:ankyrin repeat protein
MPSIRKAGARTISPVLAAVFVDDAHALRAAIAQGEPVDARDGEGRTPLFQALLDGRTSLVRALLASGADPNAVDGRGETPLHVAVRLRRASEARLLIQKGALVDAQDANGNTPLWRAVFAHQGNEEVIGTLLEHGANPDRPNRDGVTPRALAESVADPEVRQLLDAQVSMLPSRGR